MAMCDRCGAQSFMTARKQMMFLDFCLHHGKQYNQALEQQGWIIYFDTEGIDSLTKSRVSV